MIVYNNNDDNDFNNLTIDRDDNNNNDLPASSGILFLCHIRKQTRRTHVTVLRPFKFVRDHRGEPVPEETFTHTSEYIK